MVTEASLRNETSTNLQREPVRVNFDDSTSFNENPVTLEQMDQIPGNVKGKTPFCIVYSQFASQY